MNRLHFTITLLVALALVLPASASHCVGYRTSQPEFAQGGIYIDNDTCQPGCIVSIWVYQESNGLPGLQRSDSVVDDTCHGMVTADRRLV